MKMRDANGQPASMVIQGLSDISKLAADALALIAKSDGIEAAPGFIPTFSKYSGSFLLADNTIGAVNSIVCSIAEAANDGYVTGNGTSTLATLFAALGTTNSCVYTIDGDSTQIPKSGVIIAVTGGKSTAEHVDDQQAQQLKLVQALHEQAAAIIPYYGTI